MNPNAYRKMIDKIHSSEEKRKETAELLKQHESEIDPLPVNKNKTKWLSSPYIRRYAAVAACAAVVLTGILIGIPKKNIPTAENNAGETGEVSALTDTADSASDQATESSSDGALSADSSSLPGPASPADTPTSLTQPTAALQKYYLSMEPTLPKALSFYDSAAKANLLANNPLDPSFINAVQQFSWQSSSKLMAGQSGNITYSPASVYMALAMAGTGAGGHTKQEFLSLLGVNDMSFLSTQCGNLFRRSYISNEFGTMKMADSLWLDQHYEFQNNYVQNTVKNFYASIYNVDFSDGSVGDKISSWISKNTNGILKPKIKTVPNEMMSIVNTIYFKDQWVNKFDPSNTRKATFTMANGQQKSWDFMNGKVPAKSYTGDGFEGIALEMKNVGTMVFVLPADGAKPEDLLSSPEKTASLFDIPKGKPDDVYLSIPKFSMGNSEIQLKDMLMSLGLKTAFESSADFSGISKTPSCIDHVQHGAHVQIDENGAEAAAYTEIGTKASASCPIFFNRPFIYAVLSNDGIPLFIGVCEEPVYE